MNNCEKCGKPRSEGSKSLCMQCWREYQHFQKQNNLIVCSKCGKTVKQYGKGLCQACYSKEFYKPLHAKCERNRRIRKHEQIKEAERARSKTPKRIEWKKAYHQKYYQEHKEKLCEYQKTYRKSDTERQTHYKQRRRNKVNGLENSLTLDQWHEILKKYNNSCAYCGANNIELEREHKIPASLGGGFTKENIVPACGRCNRRKKIMTHDEFMDFIKKYP